MQAKLATEFSEPPTSPVYPLPHILHTEKYFREACGFQCISPRAYANYYSTVSQHLAEFGLFDLGNGTDNRFDWPVCNETANGVGKPVLCQSGVLLSVYDPKPKKTRVIGTIACTR